jgi:hypothetical protein
MADLAMPKAIYTLPRNQTAIDSAIRLLEQAIDSAIPQYAVPSCRALCSKLASLPRELRDMIYDRMLDPFWLRELRWQAGSRMRIVRWPRGDHLPHHLQVEYVGERTLCEMSQRAAELVYKEQTLTSLSFEILTMVAWPEIDLLVLPWHHFIRNFRFDVSFFDTLSEFTGIARHDYSFIPENLNDSTWSASEKYVRDTLVQGLQPLLGRRRKVVLRARELWTYQELYGKDTLQRYRQLSASVAKELIVNGVAQVDLVWKEYY